MVALNPEYEPENQQQSQERLWMEIRGRVAAICSKEMSEKWDAAPLDLVFVKGPTQSKGSELPNLVAYRVLAYNEDHTKIAIGRELVAKEDGMHVCNFALVTGVDPQSLKCASKNSLPMMVGVDSFEIPVMPVDSSRRDFLKMALAGTLGATIGTTIARLIALLSQKEKS